MTESADHYLFILCCVFCKEKAKKTSNDLVHHYIEDVATAIKYFVRMLHADFIWNPLKQFVYASE